MNEGSILYRFRAVPGEAAFLCICRRLCSFIEWRGFCEARDKSLLNGLKYQKCDRSLKSLLKCLKYQKCDPQFDVSQPTSSHPCGTEQQPDAAAFGVL